MLRKDQSLSRYPEFPDYQAHSGLILPKRVGAPSAQTADVRS
ncbi:MAG: hypothetical protein ACFB4I_16345 [Cyanophyceae cyanobacterium]